MDIDWMNFLVVLVVSVAGAIVLSVAFSLGSRCWIAREGASGGARMVQTAGVVLCWGAAACVALYGLWLILSTSSIFAH